MSSDRKQATNYSPDNAFPRSRYKNQSLSEGMNPKAAERNARFPWIHRREPVDFHSMKILP